MSRANRRNGKKAITQRTTISLPIDLHEWLVSEADKQQRAFNDVVLQAVRHSVDADRLARDNAIAPKIRSIWKVLAEGLPNPYQEIAIQWRIARTFGQIEEIRTGRLRLDAYPADDYLMRIISEMMGSLGTDDLYWTVTNLRFWRGSEKEQHATNVAEYLRSQEAAAARGMRLRRIFLIVKEDDDDCVKTEVMRQLQFHKRLQDRAAERKSEQPDVTTRFREVRRLDRQTAIDLYGHFGLIRRVPAGHDENEDDQGCVIIEPHYEGERIKNLELLFSEVSGRQFFKTQRYFLQYDDAMAGSKSLEELAAELGISI